VSGTIVSSQVSQYQVKCTSTMWKHAKWVIACQSSTVI